MVPLPRDSADGGEAPAALRIQCAWRQNSARFELRWRRLRQLHGERQTGRHVAAVKIQALQRRQGAAGAVRGRKAELRAAHAAAELRRQQEEAEAAVRAEARRKEAEAAAARERLANSASVVQRAYRSYNARFEAAWRSERRTERRRLAADKERAAELLGAAAVIQAVGRAAAARVVAWNSWLQLRRARQEQEEERRRVHDAAVAVQCSWRSYNARFETGWRREQQSQRTAHRPSVAFQAMVARRRSQLLAGEDEEEVRLQLQEAKALAAVAIQCQWRLHLARAELMRRHYAFALETLNVAAARIQRTWRRYARVHDAEWRRKRRERTAAVRIQCAWRCSTSRVAAELRFAARERRWTASDRRQLEWYAATRIQAAFRAVMGRFEGEYQRHVLRTRRREVQTEERDAAARVVTACFRVNARKAELRHQEQMAAAAQKTRSGA